LLEESIKRFGWTNPVILSKDGVILAGHARVKAAISAGNDTVPCIRTKLTGAEADAYLIADNRLSDLAPYDRDILAELLGELPDDLAELTGFDSSDIDALLKGEDISEIDKFIGGEPEEREEVDAEPQIDRAEELNKIWQVKTGDLWQCGEHRIICGDCTDPAVVERVMRGEKAEIVITDPPYGMKLDTDFSKMRSPPFKSKSGGNSYNKIIGDSKEFNPCHIFSLSDEVFLFGADYYFEHLPKGGSWLVWDKRLEESADKMFGSCFELCWSKNKHKREILRVKWAGLFGTETQDVKIRIHPAQKPIQLIIEILKRFCKDAVSVLDLYLGSGTTLIACENTSRKCRGIEISPEYCAVILQRYQDATGKEPVRING
jgi:DNA modification methylase